MKKKISERKITRQFIENLLKEHNPLNLSQDLDDEDEYSSNYIQNNNDNHSVPNKPLGDRQGNISPEDLYNHFDLNSDGAVDQQDYVNHIEYHCEYPESLNHYKKLRDISYQTIPCQKSYDTCSQHLLNNTDDIDVFIKPFMDKTGSSCRESSVKSLLDVLQSLINCGVFG